MIPEVRLLAAILALASLASPSTAMAHGGSVRIATGAAGPYGVVLTASPGPPRATVTDIAIAVTVGGVAVADAAVELTAVPPGSGRTPVRSAAQPPHAGEDRYHARVRFSESGRWALTVSVRGTDGAGVFRADVQVSRSIFGLTVGEVVTYVGLPAMLLLGLKVVPALRRRGAGAGTTASPDVGDRDGVM